MINIKNFFKQNKWLFITAFSSFIVKFIYIFNFTDYKNYLVSDMGGYWFRAIERYEGGLFSIGQWTAWAPGYHILLSFFFNVLDFLNLSDKRLELVILLNIVLSSASVFFIFFIAKKIIKEEKYIFFTTLVYAFSYPILYLNIFVLSENIVIPLLVCVIFFLIYFYEKMLLLLLAGTLLGFIVIIRPGLGLFGLPCFIYILLKNKFSLSSVFKSIVFSIGFIIIVGLGLIHNLYISNGQLQGLAGHGGANFFFQQCKNKTIHSEFQGLVVVLTPTIYADNENFTKGEFKTFRPIHDSAYFYALGNQCIKENPRIWLENIKSLKHFFIGTTFPYFTTVLGFEVLDRGIKCLTVIMIVFIGLLYFIEKTSLNPEVFLLFSMPFLTVLEGLFFIPDYRHLIPTYFAIYILFFYVISHIKKYKKEVMVYLYFLLISYFILISI